MLESGQSQTHWALEWLASLDLDPYLEELRLEGLLDNLSEEYQPIAGVGLKPPEPVPLWFPQEFQGRALSQSERLAWFDELLKLYCDSPLTWPLTDEKNMKTRRLLKSMYLMYHERGTGLWLAPGSSPPNS